MLKKLILSAILGGIILFIWTAASWMALPIHKATLHTFNDQAAVAKVIQINAPQSGIYLVMPENQAAANQPQTAGAMIFAAVYKRGVVSMTLSMIIEFITLVVAAFLVSGLLSLTRGLGYLRRVGFVLLFALAAGIVTEIPYWNWFHFPLGFVLADIWDLLIGWLLAGLVIAKIVKPKA